MLVIFAVVLCYLSNSEMAYLHTGLSLRRWYSVGPDSEFVFSHVFGALSPFTQAIFAATFAAIFVVTNRFHGDLLLSN